MVINIKPKIAKTIIYSLIIVIIATLIPLTIGIYKAKCLNNYFTNNIQLSNNTSISPCSAHFNHVGFLNDGGPYDKRIVVWEGSNIELKYDSETQKQSNQFCIWNDWYFQQHLNPYQPAPNNYNYSYYSNWECLNFWGDRPKNENNHNIPNVLSIKNVTINNQGFYNLQYNYRTVSTIGNVHHRFSSYPFQLIVSPKKFRINIDIQGLDENKSIVYGQSPIISLSLIPYVNNEINYIYLNNKNCIYDIDYRWYISNDNANWERIYSSETQLTNLMLDSGRYYIKAQAIISISTNNNFANKEMISPITINSDVYNFNVSQKLECTIPILNLKSHNSLLVSVNAILNNTMINSYGEKEINYQWYKMNNTQSWIKDENNTNKEIEINLAEANQYKLIISLLNNPNVSAESFLISINNNQIIESENKSQQKIIIDYRETSNYHSSKYNIYDSNFIPIISNQNLNNGYPNDFYIDTSDLKTETYYYLVSTNEIAKRINIKLIKILPNTTNISDSEDDIQNENPSQNDTKDNLTNKNDKHLNLKSIYIIAAILIGAIFIILLIVIIKSILNKKKR